jgi:hypothetical protein
MSISSKRQKKQQIVAIARDYVERMAPPKNKLGLTPKMKHIMNPSVGSSLGTKKKKSSVSKAYIQAYEWFHDERQKRPQSSKQKKPPTSICRTDLVDRVSFLTEPVIPDESFSCIESVSSTPTRRHNKAPGLSIRQPLSAPMPTIASRSSSTQRSCRAADRKDSSSSIAPDVLRYQNISTSDVRLDSHGKILSARSSSPRGRWNVVAILSATTLIAICEHIAYIQLQMTGLFSDIGLQFTAFFVKTTCQVLIFVYLLSKLHHKEQRSTKEQRRRAFYNFMHSHGDRMIAVDKLRAWFGDDAVYDAKILTKWVANDAREYWQYHVVCQE